jgi:hypothetical protein
VAEGTNVFFYRHESELGTETAVYTPSTLPESDIWYAAPSRRSLQFTKVVSTRIELWK